MPYPSHFVLRRGAGVDEGLSNDRQDGVNAVRHLNIQNELRIFQDVHPEPERETGDKQTRQRHRKGNMCQHPADGSPVGLPNMHSFWVVNAMFLSHVIQEVEEESDSNRRSPFGAQDGHKDVIDKLLQCPL